MSEEQDQDPQDVTMEANETLPLGEGVDLEVRLADEVDEAEAAPMADDGSMETDATLHAQPAAMVAVGEPLEGTESLAPEELGHQTVVDLSGPVLAPPRDTFGYGGLSPDKTAAEHDLGDRILRAMKEGAKTRRMDPFLGRVIADRFEVKGKLGEGGMGAVYRATQIGMGRDVAIKVLLSDLVRSETVVKRFHLEALAISKLKHPHTIQIFDFGETKDGVLFIAMEFLEGLSLHGRLEAYGPISVKQALRIAQQVAESLREAHGKDIVHRDLKPDNVFLTTVGEDREFVKVLDFGVAKLKTTDQKSKGVTKTGTITGTPRYMSPEQARGDEVDHRSDIYSLGVLLFHMVAGRVPFDADNHVEILIKHIREEAPAIHEVAPDIVVPSVLEDLLERMLSKNREDRPQSAEVVIREIGEIMDDLDPLFRKVLTRDDAVQVGLELALAPATRHDTRLTPSNTMGRETVGPHQDATLGAQTLEGQELLPRRRRPWLWVLPVALSVIVGLVLAVQPLPDRYAAFGAMASASGLIQPIEALEGRPGDVVVTVASDPSGAEAFDGETSLGKTPLVLRYPKGHPSLELTFRKAGYHDGLMSFDFEKDSHQTVPLPPIKAPKPPPLKRPAANKPKPDLDDPFDFQPGRVKSTKDNPY